jgi:hypothetical protein
VKWINFFFLKSRLDWTWVKLYGWAGEWYSLIVISFYLIAPCDKGKYSLSGYTPCKDCPVNYYQDATKQGYCKPCASNETTQGTGATSTMQCIPLGNMF